MLLAKGVQGGAFIFGHAGLVVIGLHDAEFVPWNGFRRHNGRPAVLLFGTSERMFLAGHSVKQIVELVQSGLYNGTEEADMFRIVGVQTDNPDALRLDPVPQMSAGSANEHRDYIHPILHLIPFD